MSETCLNEPRFREAPCGAIKAAPGYCWLMAAQGGSRVADRMAPYELFTGQELLQQRVGLQGLGPEGSAQKDPLRQRLCLCARWL